MRVVLKDLYQQESAKSHYLNKSRRSILRHAKICGDLGINSKNSQPDIDSSAARYKMYKRVATHKAPRIHPVKIRKKKNNKM